MKRLTAGIISGALLGIFCIIGISFRMGYSGNEIFILASWINRVIMGLVIGLLHTDKRKTAWNNLGRGAFFGLIISGSLYISTEFRDVVGFFAGIIYGMIIDFVASKYKN